MKYFTIADLGPKRRFTPEGFLVCEDAVLARTGQQRYHRREIGGDPDMFPETFVVDRAEEDVFRPETLASGNGKPVVNDHPPRGEFVTPGNYHKFSVGHILNPRRGTSDQSDLMLGDLVVTDTDAIRDIMSGKRELSLGYDARYEPAGDGMFRQRDFVINHVALVEKGRCGPRCCIGDAAHCECEDCSKMVKTKNHRLVEKLKKVFTTGDADEQTAAVEELMGSGPAVEDEAGGSGDTHIHVHAGGDPAPTVEKSEDDDTPPWFKKHMEAMDARFKAIDDKMAGTTRDENAEEGDKEIEGELEIEAPSGVTGDAVRKATDSAYLADAHRETAALAEAIVPGITIPSFDKAAKPRVTFDAIQGLRKKALELAYVRTETRDLVEQVIGGRTFDSKKMTNDGLRTTFRAVGGLAKKANNTRNESARTHDDRRGGFVSTISSIGSPADINKMLLERRTSRSVAKANR